MHIRMDKQNLQINDYGPDSVNVRNRYPYIFELFEKFKKYNYENNKGDLNRLLSFVLNIEQTLNNDNVEGSIAEVGVYKGNSAAILAHFAKEYNKTCYLFDTYEGFDDRDIEDHKNQKGFNPLEFDDTSIELVTEVIGDNVKSCEFIKGYFPECIPSNLKNKTFSIVSLDCDLYNPMKASLEWFYPRMNNKSIFLIHDYSSGYFKGVKRAVDEFCNVSKQHLILMPDKGGSAFIKIYK